MHDAFVHIAGIVTRGLSDFLKDDYHDAMLFLVAARQKEAIWKAEFKSNEAQTNGSNLDNVGFSSVVDRVGRICLKVNRHLFPVQERELNFSSMLKTHFQGFK